MKIIIAIDSFKGSLSSIEAGEAAIEGIQEVLPNSQTELIPIADGGEGMLAVMLNTHQGTVHTIQVHNPCMEPINAAYGIAQDSSTAFIEMATASGLPLIREDQRNPMRATTLGTGELIIDALEKGCTQFIIGIGGSATNDAGTGMLQALGFQFLDKDHQPLGHGGKILSEIASIDYSNVHPQLKNAHFTIACDVRNPFYGPNGAAYIYARQKGANDAMIAELDKGMNSFAKIIEKETGKDIQNIPGSGAAGGMGGGILAFLNAELKSGADLLLDICEFEKKIQNADIIITGEGRIDKQSLMGKIPGKILQMGLKHNIPVIAIAGSIEDEPILTEAGFHGVYATKPKEMPLEKAMMQEEAIRNIRETTSRIFTTQHHIF